MARPADLPPLHEDLTWVTPLSEDRAAHPPDHPDAAEVRERAAAQRAAYLDGYRGVLGMAYLCLVAV